MKTNILKRTIFLTSLLLITTVGLAQRKQGPPPQPSSQQINQMIDDLSSELNLTSSQTSQISNIFSEHFNEMKSKRGKKSGSKRPDQSAMEGSRQEFEAQIKQVLSPDQITAYEKFMRSRGPQSQRPNR
ncbi:MAG: hypothetical protein HQ506_09160 [Candidatus Marinimicrobia bacterium]|nr:hypothetical protein [Candidatus Neomarinimicrobiota bacterium]